MIDNFEICDFFERVNGGEGRKVGEHSAVVIFELEAYPEPKALSCDDLKTLIKRFKTTVAVAKYIGASQSFVSFKLIRS